jgi:hypothetical protein
MRLTNVVPVDLNHTSVVAKRRGSPTTYVRVEDVVDIVRLESASCEARCNIRKGCHRLPCLNMLLYWFGIPLGISSQAEIEDYTGPLLRLLVNVVDEK